MNLHLLKMIKHDHDCLVCKPLGSFSPKSLLDLSYGSVFDLYYCPKAGLRLGGVVARYGNKPNQKIECLLESMKDKLNIFESINEAYSRYKKMNK